MREKGAKSLLAVAVFAVILLFVSCGKVNNTDVYELTKDANHVITVTVNISKVDNPTIIILAKDITVDKLNLKVHIKGSAFLTSVDLVVASSWIKNTAAILSEGDQTISVPLGGKITVQYPNGSVDTLERYGSNYVRSEAVAK